MDTGQGTTSYRRFWAHSTFFPRVTLKLHCLDSNFLLDLSSMQTGSRNSQYLIQGWCEMSFEMEERKVRYDAITDSTAEKHLSHKCLPSNTGPNSDVASNWHGRKDMKCSERRKKSL